MKGFVGRGFRAFFGEDKLYFSCAMAPMLCDKIISILFAMSLMEYRVTFYLFFAGG